MRKTPWIFIWLPLALAMMFGLGMIVSYRLYRAPELSPAQKKFNNILDIVSTQYVDDVDIDSLLERTIPYLISNLDPHSVYISASEVEAANSQLEGSFSGVGVSFQIVRDTICVVEVIPGGPAHRMGLVAGDRIVTINDSTAVGLNSEGVFAKLRGKKGSKVNVGIVRSGSPEIRPFTLVRDDIPVNSVMASYLIDKNIGYVKVDQFSRNTYNEFMNAMNGLRLKGARKYIIDLRGNPGGYMEPAVLMVNEFLKRGESIVQTRGRNLTDLEKLPIKADGNGQYVGADLAVLIDETSASASEIFAGAIQDNDRGLVIGRRSFGKGLVQQQLNLPDNSALRLTVQRYYTPSGRCIQKDYRPGDIVGYESEIYTRFDSNGEAFQVDSIKVDKTKAFKTVHGRTVYGGGGITPDVYVPSDTAGVNRYYREIVEAGLIQLYAFEFADMNREMLSKHKTVESLLADMPADEDLIASFGYFVKDQGKELRWFYLNHSAATIVNQVKALIARDILGMDAYYKVSNTMDAAVSRATQELRTGKARAPIR